MKKIIILSLIPLFFLNANDRITPEDYKSVSKGITKNLFENMTKDYQKNAAKNYEKFTASNQKMKEKYNFKGTKEEMIAIMNQEKVNFIKDLLVIDKMFLESIDINDLFKSIVSLRALNKSSGFTKEEYKKYTQKIRNGKRKESLKIYKYKNKLLLKIKSIEQCYLNAVDPLSLDNCTEKLDKFRNSKKINSFISHYMEK